MTGKSETSPASTSRNKRQKFVTEEGYVDFQAAYKDQIRSIKDQENQRRRSLRSKDRRRRAEQNAAMKARGEDPMAWDDLEIITFDPRRPKHARMQEVLRRGSKDRERRDLVARLETEFCRLYGRYRRRADRAKGRSYSEYEVTPRERKYAAQAGVLCVQKAVTPRQVMEYWHEHIKHFRRASHMTVPGLSFLSAAANIDTVACAIVPDDKAPGGGRVVKAEVLTKPKAGNSFSDTSGLDVRLRPGLEEAGYPTQDFNDRYLLTVQKTAIALAHGKDIFIAKGALRDMSRWAATNLYGD